MSHAPAPNLDREAVAFFLTLQDQIVAGLQALDGQPFREDS